MKQRFFRVSHGGASRPIAFLGLFTLNIVSLSGTGRLELKGSKTVIGHGTPRPKQTPVFQAFRVNVWQTPRRCSNFEGFPMRKQAEERSEVILSCPPPSLFAEIRREERGSIIILIIPCLCTCTPACPRICIKSRACCWIHYRPIVIRGWPKHASACSRWKRYI